MAVSQLRGRSRHRDQREGPAFFDDLLAMAGSLANSRKEYASTQLENLADSLRQFGESLPSLPTMKGYAEAAAGGLEDLAGYVVDSDLPDMVSDAREMARRHPLATFGGSILAGLVITQLVQARTEAMRASLRPRSAAAGRRSGSRNSSRSRSGDDAESDAAA